MGNLDTATPEERRQLEGYLAYLREHNEKVNMNTNVSHYQYNGSDMESKIRQRLSQLNPEFAITGKVKQLTQEELDLLQFCHDTDMHQFLKEEFEKHPIKYDFDTNPETCTQWMRKH